MTDQMRKRFMSRRVRFGLGMVAATDDMHEGLKAFLEKRPAKFVRR